MQKNQRNFQFLFNFVKMRKKIRLKRNVVFPGKFYTDTHNTAKQVSCHSMQYINNGKRAVQICLS